VPPKGYGDPPQSATLVGGDTFATATPIPALPYVDTGNTCTFTNDYDPPCVGEIHSARDVVYSFAPNANVCVDISLCGSGYDTEVVVYQNNVGTPVACQDDSPTCGLQSRLSNVPLIAGNTYYIVVDGYAASTGSFLLTITPPAGAGTCASPTVLPAGGGSVLGATSGSSGVAGTCGGAGAPEKVFSWTPTRSGVATLQTCSTTQTTYDTVLYLRDTTCAGAELACNDDTAGCGTTTDVSNPHRGSKVTPTVTAGHTYVVVVDGYGADSGSFSLTVTAPP